MPTPIRREYFEYPFNDEHRDKINNIIDNQFDKYLTRKGTTLQPKERDTLRNRVIDQLSEYMTELSENKIRWSMASEVITIKVKLTNTDSTKNKIQRYSKKMRDNYRFLEKSNKWECSYDEDVENRGGLSYDDFINEVYSEVYMSASTAAFYGIASWFE